LEWGGGLGLGIGVWGLEKFNTIVPFSPTFPFVPLLPVSFLLVPFLPKINLV